MKKRKKTITETQLKTIIKDCLNKYLVESQKGVNSFRVDVTPNEIEDIRKSLPKTEDEIVKHWLKEGLISSYPSQKIKNILMNTFGLSERQIVFNTTDTGEKNVETITLILNSKITSDDLGRLINKMNACGYFPICGFEQYKRNKDLGEITFEPKFTQDIGSKIREKCQYLFHVTPSVMIGKIRKNGLIPKSKNTIFQYPDRIYFMEGDMLTYSQILSLKNIQIVRNNTNPQGTNPKDNLNYSLLTLALEKIPKDVKFYKDPLAKNAVFTYDNIPASSIIKIQDFTL